MEKMGRRKLAYTVRKFNDGNYVLLTIEADGAVVLELERRLRVTEPVIKFITVRIDEEEKRLAKVKALRGVRRSASVCGTGCGCRLQPAPAAVEAAACGAGRSGRAGRGSLALSTVKELPSPLPLLSGQRQRPDPVIRPARMRPTGSQESEEETECLKRIKQQAQRKHRRFKPGIESGSGSAGPFWP